MSTIDSQLILELQYLLINLKNLYPSMPILYPTGLYDNNTRDSIIIYQGLKEFPQTGIVDFITWSSLINDNNDYMKRSGAPDKIPVSPRNFTDLKIGDDKDTVYAVKRMLNKFYKKYANYIELSETNIFDDDTQRAVMLFQERSMLPVTGIVDLETWNTLVKIYDACKFFE